MLGFLHKPTANTYKKAIRVICMSKYNAHTDPLFKNLKLLNVFDLFKLNSLQFAYKYHKETLPDYFSGMFDSVEIHHDYNTRHHIQHDPQPKRSTTEKCMRYFVPTLLHDTQDCITEKLFTHSIHGFTIYTKNCFLEKYETECQIINCYICGNRDG